MRIGSPVNDYRTNEEVEEDSQIITSIGPRGIKVKINFRDPSAISLSDQSYNDELKIGLNTPLYGTNGLLMSTDKIGANEQGIPEPRFDIQPMVDENSPEQKTLDASQDSIFNLGMLMILLQFVVTYYAQTSVTFFWDLINSQINYCYLPLLRVNPPGQIGYYFKTLLLIVTMDPLPIE